jgi:23S rRNA (guanosine2251-2'-O)-methyltransferase
VEKETKIYGIRAILEAIEADKSVDKLFLQRGLQGSLMKSLEGAARKKGINTVYVPIEKLDKLTQNNHQGAVATISPIEFYDFETLVNDTVEKEEKPLFLLLDQLSDVRNFGAIIRTAACTGVHGIVIQKKGAAPVTADTIKTSAGAAFTVPIAKVAHLKDAIYYLQSSGVQVVAATEKASDLIYQNNFNTGTALVMGSEDLGISPSLLKIVDAQAKLPMMGTIASLNVSVACSVFLYEVVRQRISEE